MARLVDLVEQRLNLYSKYLIELDFSNPIKMMYSEYGLVRSQNLIFYSLIQSNWLKRNIQFIDSI